MDTSTRATATRRSRCSRSVSVSSTAPRRAGPRPAGWRPCSPPWPVISRPVIVSWPRGRCSGRPWQCSEPCSPGGTSTPPSSTVATWTPGSGRSPPVPASCTWRLHRIRCSRSSTSPPWRNALTPSVLASWSTTCSQLRPCSDQWSSGPTSWSTRPPSIWTGRGGPSAVPCSARRSSSTALCASSSDTPGRRSVRSMPG